MSLSRSSREQTACSTDRSLYRLTRKKIAMVGERQAHLTELEEIHITSAYASPSQMHYLDRVASDVPKRCRHRKLKCHCCVEAKMKHKPMPGRSMTVITTPGEVVSVDIVRPFQIPRRQCIWSCIHRSLHKHAFSLWNGKEE
jgi:hypothetical protein